VPELHIGFPADHPEWRRWCDKCGHQALGFNVSYDYPPRRVIMEVDPPQVTWPPRDGIDPMEPFARMKRTVLEHPGMSYGFSGMLCDKCRRVVMPEDRLGHPKAPSKALVESELPRWWGLGWPLVWDVVWVPLGYFLPQCCHRLDGPVADEVSP
jgi:hypothetical protein